MPKALTVTVAPLTTAVRRIGGKTPLGAKLSSKEWGNVPLAVRERAFFSAKVESARFLQSAQELIAGNVRMQKERIAPSKVARGGEAVISRDSFIGDMHDLAVKLGLNTTPDGKYTGTVRDIRSVPRLGMIYDMQRQQAFEYSRWKMGQDSDVLNEFPAQRLLRSTADEPRQPPYWENRWQRACIAGGDRKALALFRSTGEIAALKTSRAWVELSAFGTPWPPFDFGSQRTLEDVDRDEAVLLGLISKEKRMKPVDIDFNRHVEASIEGLSPETRRLLKDAFGSTVQIIKRQFGTVMRMKQP